MTSYLVYATALMRHFLGLSTICDRSQVLVYNYFSQLTLSKSLHHFRRVNDAFFAHYICLFDKELHNERVSNEVWKVVSEYSWIFLQFPTFTYIRIGCFDREPFILPRYPSDKIICIKMSRQIISIHELQSRAHKIGLKFSITIGRYSINSIYKACSMEEEMRRVTLRLFKVKNFFNYKGMRNKIKNNYTHIHRIEYVWVDCCTKEDVQRMDYYHLTVEQIENVDLANVPKDLEENGDILDPKYEINKVVGLPLPPYNGLKRRKIL